MSVDVALKRACPICGHDCGVVLHSQQFLAMADFSLPSSYDVVSCNQCSFVFADVDGTQADYDDYYARQSKYENATISSGSGSSAWDHRRLSATADELTRHIPTEARVLDVGTAQGGLLQILAKRGYASLAALEISAACVAKLPRAIQGYVGTLHNLKGVFDTPFDAVILSHVLEHIYDISGAIKNLGAAISKDGLLYVEVPDASQYANYFKTGFHYFDVEHINHFDLASLNTLFSLYGFEAITSGSKEIEVSSSELYLAIFSVFRRKRLATNVARYVKLSRENDNSDELSALAKSGAPVSVWGFGSYTRRLLVSTDLHRCNLLHIVDGDVKKHGAQVGALKIESPEVLRDFSGTVIISSVLYSQAISEAMQDMGLRHPTIILR